MRSSVFIYLLLFVGLSTSCTKNVEGNRRETSDFRSAETNADNSQGPIVTNQQIQVVEHETAPTQTATVQFDGRNYIKKGGWKIPPKNGTSIQNRELRIVSVEGQSDVTVTVMHYVYNRPRFFSEDFLYEGKELEILKGRLKSEDFTEFSVNGRIFMVSISAEKVVPQTASNTDPHTDQFVYRIMDTDGDGVYESFLGHSDMYSVPAWVRK